MQEQEQDQDARTRESKLSDRDWMNVGQLSSVPHPFKLQEIVDDLRVDLLKLQAEIHQEVAKLRDSLRSELQSSRDQSVSEMHDLRNCLVEQKKDINTLKEAVNFDAELKQSGHLSRQLRPQQHCSVDLDPPAVQPELGIGVGVEQEKQQPPAHSCDELQDVVHNLEGHLKNTYALKASVWDAGLFLGYRPFGIPNSMNLGMAMLCNLFVQAAFSAIMWRAFKAPDITEDIVLSLWAWRLNSAHDASNVQTFWPVSLASRTCARDVSSIASGNQQAYVADIQGYRISDGKFVGVLLCMLCLLCFWITLWNDLDETITFAQCIQLAVGKHTSIIPTDGGIKIESISLGRAIFVRISILFRFAITINLGIVGTIWLADEISIGDIFLNALALGLILNVDELVYAGLIASSTKDFVENCEPLMAWSTRIGCIDKRSLAGILMVWVLMPCLYSLRFKYTTSLLDQAWEALCGGKQNFVYGVDALGFVYVHDGMPQINDPTDMLDIENLSDTPSLLLRSMALREVVRGIPREEWQYAIYEPTLGDLKTRIAMLPSAALSKSSICEDILSTTCLESGTCGPYLETWRFATDNSNLKSCSDAEPYCYGLSAIALLTKSLCPVTCGCSSPATGGYVIGDMLTASCPSECADKLREIINYNKNRLAQCPDDANANNSMWQRWMREARLVLHDDLRKPLEKHGCLGLNMHPDEEKAAICLGLDFASILKPLVDVCPRACGCIVGSRMRQCSEACTSGDP